MIFNCTLSRRVKFCAAAKEFCIEMPHKFEKKLEAFEETLDIQTLNVDLISSYFKIYVILAKKFNYD